MTKSSLIDRLCERWNVPVGRGEQIVDAIFEALEQALNRGERIEIRGFGSFETRSYKGYTGRNPRTGSQVDVKPKRLPFFKAGKELKDRIDEAARRTVAARTPRETAAPDAAAAPEHPSSTMLDQVAGAP
jgi:integration host factor subunit beta